MAHSDISGLANELAQAIEITMSVTSSNEQRMQAYVACEKFKDMSPLCAQAGFYLVTNQFSPIVKHFGLQLMEHTVKFNWNNISQQEKVFIKENSMKLLSQGIGPAEDSSLQHLKDALSRVVVEMIKREWPQQWNGLLGELSEACSGGTGPTELVALVLLRLVEDVALLQTLDAQKRRKDIYQALTAHMRELCEFFLKLIELHVGEFRTAQPWAAGAHARCVQVALQTLSGFVEWIAIGHVMCDGGKLLQMLCILLNDRDFQVPAAECLAQITHRKGLLKDRRPLLALFGEDHMRHIYQAALAPNSLLFVKRLAATMLGLTQQLCILWGKEEGLNDAPPTMRIYLEVILAFARNTSAACANMGVQCWLQLLKHDQASKNRELIEYVPRMLEIVGPRVAKGKPTEDDLEEGAEEYAIVHLKLRQDILEMFRQSTLVSPLVTFAYCEHWLRFRLQNSSSEINTSCSILDRAYVEWEALVAVLDGVLSRILLVPERPSTMIGLQLLEQCLQVRASDPLIQSILLSCISALFVFLSMSAAGAQLLPRVLDKVFECIVRQPAVPATVGNVENLVYITAARNLRRHSAALLVKIALKYPLLLLPGFDHINSTMLSLVGPSLSFNPNLSNRPNSQLTSMEQIMVQEALLIISNHFGDCERQMAFVAEVIRPTVGTWHHLATPLSSPIRFMEHVGLKDERTEDLELYHSRRQELMVVLNTALGVVKRCQAPDDPDKALRGGFVVAQTKNGNPIYRNPATPQIMPLLPHVLSLLKVLHELFLPSSLDQLSPAYKTANNLPDSEQRHMLGLLPSSGDPLDPVPQSKTPLDRHRIFLGSLHEHNCHLLGALGPALGRDFYALPGLAQALIGHALCDLHNLPAQRLRIIVRTFLKPYIYACPAQYYKDALWPVLAHVAPFMLSYLTSRWQYITSLYECGQLGGEEDAASDVQEVMEDLLNRTLSREYLEVLKTALVGGSSPPSTDESAMSLDVDDQSMDGQPQITRAAQSAMQSDVISELGRCLLSEPNTCQAFVTTIFNCISWNDSCGSLKATFLGGPVIRHIASEGLITSQLAGTMLMRVLQGLQFHGQHDANQAALITLGVQVYEFLRASQPDLVLSIMQQIPQLVATDLQKLDEKVLAGQPVLANNKIDKTKKDLFKRITQHLVGRDRGQLFRKVTSYADLPTQISNGKQNKVQDVADLSGLFKAK